MTDLTFIADILKRAADEGQVPGVIAAVATDEGPIFEGAFGKRDLASGAAMTNNTVLQIASMTKAVTGACAMQLVEHGKLSLDAPIGSVLPQVGAVKVLEGYDQSGNPKLREPKRAVTLRHLLTHTSGYVYDVHNGDIALYREKTGTPPHYSGFRSSLSVPLAFDPGERWQYGIGIDWAGQAVEAVSGLRLADYMKRNLFDPLGMVDTCFRLNEEQRQRLAQLYLRTAEGLQPFDRGLPKNPEFDAGGGGLYSTVSDYLKFAQMILRGGTYNGVRVLKSDTVALMQQNAIGDLEVRRLPPSEVSNAVDIIDGMKWGLSFMINPRQMDTGRAPGSLWWAGVVNTYFWIDPAKKVTGVCATQILPFFDANTVKLADEFETAVYRAL